MDKKMKVNEKNNQMINKENMINLLDLPPETNKEQSKTSVFGTQRVVIENHYGLVECFDDRVIVKSKTGWILVKGELLKILKIDDNVIVVDGDIKSVENAK